MNIYSVIVCYRPDMLRLNQLCKNLLVDGAMVVLIDNTEQPYLSEQQLPEDCQLLTLGYNAGIARAQNLGIELALKGSADVVVFFDQDSQVEPGFLKVLTSSLTPGDPQIVSPSHRDDISQELLPSVRLDRRGLPKAVYPGDSALPYPVDVIIASGTAATRKVFEVAGTLDEGLFIDYVDTEWCLRCRSHDIPICVIPAAVMYHRIGSGLINLRIATIQVHSSTRCYYQLRNCFHLFRKKHIPILFALRESVSVVLSRLALLVFVGDRIKYAKAYWAALRDGLKGILGSRP